MEIREYLPENREVCAAIWLTSETASCPGVDEDVSIARYPQVYHELLPRLATLVAYQDGAVEGFLSADPTGEILLFHTAVCFQKKGHGSALLAEAKKRFPAGLAVTIHSVQTVARAVLEKNGFSLAPSAPEPDAAGDRLRFIWVG